LSEERNGLGRQKRVHKREENGSRDKTGSAISFQNCISGYISPSLVASENDANIPAENWKS
jgi:hypothetical protein